MGKKVEGRGVKLTWDDVEGIRADRVKGLLIREMAKKYGVSRSTIMKIIHHKSWKGKRPGPLKGRKTGRAPGNKTAAPKDTWPEKVRQAKQKKNASGLLTVEQYNEMYDAYVVKQSASYVSSVTGISETTAKKYINKGDPGRSLRPLKDRFARMIEQTQERQDYDLSVARGEMQKIGRAMLVKLAKRINDLDPSELKPFQIVPDLKNLQAVLERTLGVSDATVTLKSESRFDGWTDEQLETFITTGAVPEHDGQHGANRKSDGL